MVNIESAINYPFKDKNWKKTLGVYFLIVFGIGVVSQMLSIFFQATNILFNGLLSYANSTTGSLISYSADSIVSLIAFPVTLYLIGYVIDLTRNVMNGNEETHVAHGNVWGRIKNGLAPFLYDLIIGIFAVIMIFVALIPAMFARVLEANHPGLSLFAWICFAFVFFIFFIIVVGVVPIILKSMYYIFVKENSISAGLNTSRITEVVKKEWKKLYFLYFVDIVCGLVTLMAVLSCCLVFIVSPILTSIVVFAKAYINGNVFRAMSEDEKGVVKKTTVTKVVKKTVAKKTVIKKAVKTNK